MVHVLTRSFFAPKSVVLLVALGLLGCGQGGKDELSPGAVRGTLRMRIADFDDHSETLYRLVTKSETLELTFANRPPLASVGAEVAVRGVRDGQRMRVEALDLLRTEETLELDLPAKQALRMALIIVDSTYTTTRGRQRLLQAADSPAAFYRDNSYGDWTIEGDAFGPYTIDIPNCNDSELDPIAARASAAAQAAGVDVSQYDNLMFYLPASAGCTWGGIAEVGTNPTQGFKNGKNTWYRSDGCVVFAQELGHNFGLLHSHTCTAPPYASSDYGNAACAGFREYGDAYTPMGGGCGHFNAPEAGSLGLISGCNTVAVAGTGTFEIGPIEARCGGPQVLRVAGATNVNQGPQYIYAEYRLGQGTLGSDTRSLPGVYLHASAEYGGNLTNTVDPDHRYAVDPFLVHAPLGANQEWMEPTSGVTFRVVAAGPTATVQLTFAAGGAGAPKCIDGSTPPATPMCGSVVVDGGPGGSGGAGGGGGSRMDGGAASDGAGIGGSAGKGGSAGQGGGGGGAGSGTAGTSGSASGGNGGATSGPTGTGGDSGGAGVATTTGSRPPSGGQDSGCGCSTLGAKRASHGAALFLGVASLIPCLRRGGLRRFRVWGSRPKSRATSA
jgi:Gametolysin peptidase M11